MDRRRLLGTVTRALGGGAAVALLGREAFAQAGDACLKPKAADTPMVDWPKKSPPYAIALSNSYIGNTWRTEMVQIAQAYSQKPDVKPLIKSFKVSSSGNQVSAQIAQIDQMILSRLDAIIVDAATSSGLNSAIDRAVASGILVVSFDNVVTTPKAVLVNEDQFEIGRRLAEFDAKQIDGEGLVLMVRGVAGTFVDQERTDGANTVFDKHPKISTHQVYGNWDDGTAQNVTANALASGLQVDAVWCQGGTTGVVRAFQQAGRKIPPVAGEAENGFRKLAAELEFPMLSIGQSPALSALAMKAAIDILQGKKVPRSISVPLPTATNATLKAGVNYFPDLPDSFFTAINIPNCGFDFNVKDILAQKI